LITIRFILKAFNCFHLIYLNFTYIFVLEYFTFDFLTWFLLILYLKIFTLNIDLRISDALIPYCQQDILYYHLLFFVFKKHANFQLLLLFFFEFFIEIIFQIIKACLLFQNCEIFMSMYLNLCIINHFCYFNDNIELNDLFLNIFITCYMFISMRKVFIFSRLVF
jgi:hypothetical protein